MKVLKSVELSNQEAAWYLRTGRSRKIEYVNQQLKKPRLASDDRRKSKISNKRWRACGYVSWLRQTIRDLYLDSSSSFKYSKTHLWFNVFFRVLRTFFFFFFDTHGKRVYVCKNRTPKICLQTSIKTACNHYRDTWTRSYEGFRHIKTPRRLPATRANRDRTVCKADAKIHLTFPP